MKSELLPLNKAAHIAKFMIYNGRSVKVEYSGFQQELDRVACILSYNEEDEEFFQDLLKNISDNIKITEP